MSVRKERSLNKKKNIFELEIELKKKAKDIASKHVDKKPIKYMLK